MEAANVYRAITVASQANAALCVANVASKISADVITRSRRRGTNISLVHPVVKLLTSTWRNSTFLPVPFFPFPSTFLSPAFPFPPSHGGTAAAAPPPSGLATLPSVGAVP